MFTHNLDFAIGDVIVIDEIDAFDVDCMDAPEDFDSATFTFDPFVV